MGSGRAWVIDPIDGTKNFVRRVPVWATLIALTVDGVAQVGWFRHRLWGVDGGRRPGGARGVRRTAPSLCAIR